MKRLTLSIIIPVFNEEVTIARVIEKVLQTKVSSLDSEIIVVNDGSTDGTTKTLGQIKRKNVRIINLEKNVGKGNAIKQGIEQSRGDILIIQDADLEYDPADYHLLLAPIMTGKADVTYGSRFVGHQAHRVHYFWHSVGNRFLTLLSNILTNLNLTDMETGYKVFTRKIANQLKLEEKRFGFEPEFTARVAALKVRIYEVGVSYSGRSYGEGKKISWIDGMQAIWCIMKYNLFSRFL